MDKPLGLGELLDRAITLLAKNFVALLLTIAVVSVPVAIISHLTLPPTTDFLQGLNAFLLHPSAVAFRSVFVHPNSHAPLGGAAASVMRIAMFLVGPLSTAAVIAAIAAIYEGRVIDLRSAYALALKRWLSVIVVEVMYFLAFVVCLIAIVVVATIAALLLSGGFGSQARAAGFVIGFVVAIVVGVVPFSWLWLANYFALAEVIVGTPNPLKASGIGYGRVLKRGFRLRSLAVAIAAGAVTAGSWIISMFVSMLLFDFGQNSIVVDVASTLIGLVSELVFLGFVTVAYLDTKVREDSPFPAVATA